MEELKQRLLIKLKKLKNIRDTQSDDVFLFALETSICDVLNYCHFGAEDWPETLDNTAILMTIDLINETSYLLSTTESETEVKSLSEGDFSITKETKAEAYQKMMSVPSFSCNYKRNLNSFRRLR